MHAVLQDRQVCLSVFRYYLNTTRVLALLLVGAMHHMTVIFMA
jgi:hypothetical protein